MEKYMIAQLDEIPPIECPCGQSRRAFVSPTNKIATVHMVNVGGETKAHYHKKLTEIYIFIKGTGHIELDGKLIAVKPLTTILIKPGCRHRAIGKNLKMINIPIPAFDPNDKDEWFD